MQKPTQKLGKRTFPACDSEVRSQLFPRQVQFLKAGAMGVVLAVSFFWQCKAHPAMLRVSPVAVVDLTGCLYEKYH
jgi:hypothetical protein